jgi:hypothetical protein
MDEYEAIRLSVKAGEYRFKIVKQKLDPLQYFKDSENYLKTLGDDLRNV